MDRATGLLVLRVLSPSIVFLTSLSLFTIHPPTPSSRPPSITSVVVANRVPRRAAISVLLSLAALSFLFDGLTFVIFAVLQKVWISGLPFNSIIGLAAFAGLAALGAWKDATGVEVWSLRRLKLALTSALAFDIAIATLLLLLTQNPPDIPHIPEVPPSPRRSLEAMLHIAFPVFRIVVLIPLIAALAFPRVTYTSVESEATISAPVPTSASLLLPPGSNTSPSTGLSPLAADATKYGTFRSTRSSIPGSTPTTRAPTPVPSAQDTKAGPAAQEISLDPSWSEILGRLRRLTPYLWPSKSRHLQLLAGLCILILLVGRFVNAVLPFTLGQVVRIFETGSSTSPWPFLLAYVGLRFLQGSGGLSAIRDSLWTPVMQYSDREMSQLSFDHLLNLSFAFHTRRKTGEILRVLDRGAAINRALELVLFSIVPTFIDITVALFIFCFTFEWALALVIFVVMFSYVTASVILTKWRTQLRRQMNDRDVITRGIHTDCLLNYETVKYFGGELHEGARYRDAVAQYQALEYKVIISLNLLNLVQNFIITLGLLVGSLIVAYRVTQGILKPSDFVIFITYLAQLYGPLNSLGSIYRSINQSLVDTERLLKLLNEPTEVNDKPGAPDLVVENGEIEFENVSFSYDGRGTALKGVSFKVPKGGSVALVGESGSGKSTILRLLYRFYDLEEGNGRILVDGHDIKDVTQASLRQAIGVVPQDSVLFNASIAYNIGYGKFGASQEEIESAAKSAQMHDRIMSFPDQYNTRVGERGVRLSGGEKQRVAISRTLLKKPRILLLDEASSALDTSTEKDIQKALQNLVKGRSSLSIAHRLSTIASADIILVLKDGRIVEQGNHRELISIENGVFASMWADQISASGEPSPSIVESIPQHEDIEPYVVGEEGQLVGENVASDASREPDIDAIAATPKPQSVLAKALSATEVTSDDHSSHQAPSATAAETENELIDLTDESSPVVSPPPHNEAHPVAFPPSVDQAAEEDSTTYADIASRAVESEATPAEELAVAFNADTQAVADVEPIPFPAPVEPERVESAVSFPTSPLETPSAFPSPGPSTPTQAAQPAVSSPGVTFGSEVNSPPARAGTPDPDAEPKRKRISSQNFQRLARRISLTTRRQGSSSSLIPNIIKRDSSPKVSLDEHRGEASGQNATESPAGSIAGDDKTKSKKDKKKEKKDAKKRMSSNQTSP